MCRSRTSLALSPRARCTLASSKLPPGPSAALTPCSPSRRSRVSIRCMSFGDPKRGAHPWTLDEESSRPLIRQAVEAGINFFDTANVYSAGTSEEIVGRALRDFGRRDELVIATKVHGRMHDGPNGAGLSRKAIMAEVDASLSRLGADHIDLYQIHRGPVYPNRGDAGGPARCREGRQGVLHRRVIDERLAVLQGPLPRPHGWPHLVRVHAEPLQPAQPGRGAGDAAAVRRSGSRRHPLESSRLREAHP